MKVTLITATYNSELLIEACLQSVADQSYDNIEHIVIDGASSDNTLGIVKSFSSVSKVISEPDNGIYDALNKGIAAATGDIIGFLHSDDILFDNNTINNIVDAFISQELYLQQQPDVVYGDLIYTDRENTTKILRYWKSLPYKISRLKKGWMPPHPTVFMKKHVYDKHGHFNMHLKCSADYDHILRVFNDRNFCFYYLPEVITRMRIGGISNTGIKNILTKKREDLAVLKSNMMPFPFAILLAKNISKIPQYFLH